MTLGQGHGKVTQYISQTSTFFVSNILDFNAWSKSYPRPGWLDHVILPFEKETLGGGFIGEQVPLFTNMEKSNHMLSKVWD